MYTHSDKNQVLKPSDLNSGIHSWGSGLSGYIIKQIIFPLKVRTSRPQSFSKLLTIHSPQHTHTQAAQHLLTSYLIPILESIQLLLWEQRRAAPSLLDHPSQQGNLLDNSMLFTNGT